MPGALPDPKRKKKGFLYNENLCFKGIVLNCNNKYKL